MKRHSASKPERKNDTTVPGISRVLARSLALAIVFGLLIFLSACGQTGQTGPQGAAQDQKAAAAPPHDISGTWDPGPSGAIQADGAKNFPSDGKHNLPFTPLGEQTFKAHKPGFGITQVPVALANDPMDICDPQGFPRIVLHNFRSSEIVQTATQVLILYEFNKIWRVIWTDGRQLPQDPEPRWFGYSVGQWASPDTFVAQTAGTDERTW